MNLREFVYLYNLLKIICVGLMLSLFTGCELGYSVSDYKKNPRFRNEFNAKNCSLYIADSLVYHMFIEEAVSHYREVLKSEPISDKIRHYITSKINRLKFEFDLTSDMIDISYDDSDFLFQDRFYLNVKENYTAIQVSKLKKELLQTSVSEIRLDMLHQLSLYYDYIADDTDSSAYYNSLLLREIENENSNSIWHFRYVHQLINLYSYNRQDLSALSAANVFLDGLDVQRRECFLAKMIVEKRSYALLRLGMMELSLEDVDDIVVSMQKDSCSALFQKGLKLQLYNYLYLNEDSLFQSTYSFLYNMLANCERDYVDVHQIAGRREFLSGNFENARKYLELSKSLINQCDKSRNMQDKSVYFMLSTLYAQSGNFDVACQTYINLMYSGDWDGSYLNLLEENFGHDYQYADFMQIGGWLLEKWYDDKDIFDLNLSKKFLDKSSELSRHIFRSLDQTTLLSFMDYHLKLYQFHVNVNYELYLQTGSIESLQDCWYFSSLQNSILLIQEQLLVQSQSKFPKHLSNERLEHQVNLKNLLRTKDVFSKKFNQLVGDIDVVEKRILEYFTSEQDLLGFVNDATIRFDSVQSLLDADESLLSYNVNSDYLYTFHLTSDTLEVNRKVISNSDIDSLRRFQNSIATSKSSIANIKKLGKLSFDFLLGDSLLSRTRGSLIVAQNIDIGSLNFEAFVLNDSGGGFSDLNYLIKNRNIEYCISEQFLDKNGISHNENVEPIICAFSFSDNKLGSEMSTGLTELIGAYREVSFIESTNKRAQAFYGCDATIPRFKKCLLGASDIIHLAVHGKSDSKVRDNVKLYFKKENCELDSMYGYEILNYDLNGKNIVLSSCNSDSGKGLSGSGPYTWTRYFILAGAQSVTSSQWNLNDESTADIFHMYYNFAFDMHETKLKYIATNERTHPHYWAGLIKYR